MTDYSFLHNEEILKTLKNIEKQSGIPEDLAKKIQVMKGDAGKDGSSITAIETKDLDDSVEIKVSFTDRDPQSFTVQKLKGLDGKDGTDGTDGCTPVKGKDYFDGEPGAPGKKGDPGRPGKPGTDGKDGKSITWRGVWNSNNSYSVQDTVEYNGSSYIAVNPNKGTLPTGTDWNLMAQKGRDGISRGGTSTSSAGSSSSTQLISADGSSATILDQSSNLGAGIALKASDNGTNHIGASHDLGIYANTLDDGSGSFSPSVVLNVDGSVVISTDDPTTSGSNTIYMKATDGFAVTVDGNYNGYINPGAITGNRTLSFPDASGTIATQSYVDNVDKTQNSLALALAVAL